MKKLTVIFLILVISTSLLASGFSSLKLGTDARTSALGSAATAFSENASIAFWNPAGLSQLQNRDFVLTVNQWIQDVKSGFVGLGWGNGKTGVGFHLLYTDIPDIEHRIGPSEDPIGTFSSNEMIFGFSFSRMIVDDVFLGVSLKGYFTKIFYHEAWGMGGDLGVLWQVTDKLSAGASLQNMGKTDKLNQKEIDLPLTGRAGIAYKLLQSDHNVTLLVDGAQIFNDKNDDKDQTFHINAGVEYSWQNRFFVRGGYSTGYNDSRSFTAGLGVIQGAWRLNYGYLPFDSGLGDAHQISLGIHF